MPERLFVPGRLYRLVLEHLEEPRGLGEPGTGVGGEPAIGIMYGELPARRTPHREATDGNAVVVDPVVALDGFDGFKHVDLTRELIGIAVAAVGVQHDRVWGS